MSGLQPTKKVYLASMCGLILFSVERNEEGKILLQNCYCIVFVSFVVLLTKKVLGQCRSAERMFLFLYCKNNIGRGIKKKVVVFSNKEIYNSFVK